LLQLPEEIKQHVSRGTLSMGHARAIAGVKNDKQKKELAEETIKNEWSARHLEEFIKTLDETLAKEKPKELNKRRDPYIDQLEESLRDRYRTTVKIKHNNNKGKIELLYYSKDDLERLLELLEGKIS
jgi:ParB family chromosome partitioning protein